MLTLQHFLAYHLHEPHLNLQPRDSGGSSLALGITPALLMVAATVN
jgi:hypothetical protein